MRIRTQMIVAFILSTAACAHGDDAASSPGQLAHGKDAAGGASGGIDNAGNGGEAGDITAGSSDPGGDGGGAGSDMMAGAGAGGEVDDASSSDADNAADTGSSDANMATDTGSIVEAGPTLRPTGVTVSAQVTPSQLEAPSNGGIPFNDPCPINQVLVGFKGTVDAIVDGGETLLRSVQGVCAPLTVSAMAPYKVSVGAGTALPVRNTVGGVAVNAMCPADQVVVGFGGRTLQFVQSLIFRCAPLVIGGSSPTFSLSIGNVTTTNEIGAPSGTMFTAINCPNNQVAVGQMPHGGADIDAFGVSCATLLLVTQ